MKKAAQDICGNEFNCRSDQ